MVKCEQDFGLGRTAFERVVTGVKRAGGHKYGRRKGKGDDQKPTGTTRQTGKRQNPMDKGPSGLTTNKVHQCKFCEKVCTSESGLTNHITNYQVTNIKPHSHNCTKIQIAPTGDRYQLASPNSTQPLAVIQSLTKPNLQGLSCLQFKLQRKIAYSHSVSENRTLKQITIHITVQHQHKTSKT